VATSGKTEPVVVNSKPIFFRGKRILDAVVDFLKVNHGVAMATEVLLTGGSAACVPARGLYVRSHFGQVVKFGTAPVSVFFMLHDTAQGANQYPASMEYLYHMMNSSGGVN
jgi:hypothetical protein